MGCGAVDVTRTSPASGRNDRDRSDGRTVEPARTRFVFKGGAAFEFRFGTKARSSSDIDFVEIKPLHELGLEGPSAIAVLGAPYQIAQKLHACTMVASDGRPSDRAHDLADLILLDEFTEFSPAETHAACVEIFQLRSMHDWPPTLAVWSHWPEIWEEIVRIDSFPVVDIEDAASRVRSLIDRIAEARPDRSGTRAD